MPTQDEGAAPEATIFDSARCYRNESAFQSACCPRDDTRSVTCILRQSSAFAYEGMLASA